MKANEAPEKIYISTLNIGDNHYSISKTGNPADKKYEVEYTRTDAFIEKTCEWIRDNYLKYPSEDCADTTKFIMDFIKYVK